MVYTDQDLVKHGTDLPNYLWHEGKTGNTFAKRLSFGVLDWNLIEKWKSKTKFIKKTNNASLESVNNNNIPQSNQQSSNRSLRSSLNRKFNFSLEKFSKSFISKTNTTYKYLKSEIITYPISHDLHSFNLKNENKTLISSAIYENEQKSYNMKALVKLTMKNGIPFFKIVVDNIMLTASVKKLPSGKDDSSLTYAFYSVNDTRKNSNVWKKQDHSTDIISEFDYKIVGYMKISSSYHAEFSGLERDLFVVRESVLFGPDFTESDRVKIELAAIIVKNVSKEKYGGLGSSKSTVVVLPGGSHGLPNGGQPSSLVDRWRSGGVCDCGGWDVGCELEVLTNEIETIDDSSSSISDRFDLCYQGRHNNKHAFRMIPLDNGFYSLEHNASSMSSLQAFSICVAVISSQYLTHIFQVNHPHVANDFIKPLMRRHRKVKSQTILHPPV